MTAEEMLYRAEIGYDVITGYSAEGISKKEWSIFLTEAQMDYIKIHLPVKATDISFEKSELISEQFSELVSDAIDESTGLLTTNKSSNQYGGISPYSTFYDVPSDFLYGLYSDISTYDTNCLNTQMEIVSKNFIDLSRILYGDTFTDDVVIASNWDRENLIEYIEVNPNELTNLIIGPVDINGDNMFYYEEVEAQRKVKVKPISHNYYVGNFKNPYKKPHSDLAWRLPSKTRGTSLIHEIISINPPNEYFLRYLRRPSPIIVFDEEYEDDTDTIQGVSLDAVFTGGVSIDCEMSESSCDNIIQRAITRAQTALGDASSVQLSGAVNAALN